MIQIPDWGQSTPVLAVNDESPSNTWSWDRCLESIRSLNGRLGFPQDPMGRIRFLKYEVRPDEREIIDELKGAPASHPEHLLALLYHYSEAQEAQPKGKLVAFREFSGGSAYQPAFKRRVIDRAAEKFGRDPSSLRTAVKSLGGEELSLSDHSYSVPSFPLVPLTVMLWPEDEEFSASANVLFDSSAESFLPTEPLLILAELVLIRLERVVQLPVKD